MLAPDGRCKTFDARADGFVRGEGCGVVRPQARSSDALPTAIRPRGDPRLRRQPRRPQQRPHGAERPARRRRCSAQALAHAGVAPGRSPATSRRTARARRSAIRSRRGALGAVLGAGRARAGRRCLIGSVKTNIGHLEAAAGVAGLIKVVLAPAARRDPAEPASPRSRTRTSPGATSGLPSRRRARPWPPHRRSGRAGVSSFGIAGTNAHVVLRGGARRLASPRPRPVDRVHLVPLSAHSPEALRAMAQAYRALARREAAGVPAIHDLGYTASVRRTHHDHRLALVVRSREELAEHLDAFLQDELRPGLSAGRRIPGRRRKVVFVFPGQGSQWAGMARDLLEQEPVFREALARCDRAIQAHAGWSVRRGAGRAGPARPVRGSRRHPAHSSPSRSRSPRSGAPGVSSPTRWSGTAWGRWRRRTWRAALTSTTRAGIICPRAPGCLRGPGPAERYGRGPAASRGAGRRAGTRASARSRPATAPARR